MTDERWLLPVGVEEILPPQAAILEALRRDVLDLYTSWGYELVEPPLIEYLDSLLTGTGQDLNLETFKLIDQLNGHLLGVRADITPQVARIDAHQLRRETPTRLCYLGTVLHTRINSLIGTRSPLQIGAELYGHTGIESEIEIVQIMLLTLKIAGITDIALDLGHVGIYRGLVQQAGLNSEQEYQLFTALQRKAFPEIEILVKSFGIKNTVAEMLIALAELNGNDALIRAEQILSNADFFVKNTLIYLQKLGAELQRWIPDLALHYDLAELRGYRYKTGVVFAAFLPGWGVEIARGGRYDDIGKTFGRARPAVGFSTDLKSLLQHGSRKEKNWWLSDQIYAPWSTDVKLREIIAQLRAAGRRVVNALPGFEVNPHQLGCREKLVQRDDGCWELIKLDLTEKN